MAEKGGGIMAHECPDCYQVCYCNGDIDDLILNEEKDLIACTHCLHAEEDADREMFGDDADFELGDIGNK